MLVLAQFCAAHDDSGGSFEQSAAWAKESWCYMPCDTSICVGIPRTQTAYLWRATVNNIDLCYSYEVCGGVDYFTGEAKVCLAGGGFYVNGACACSFWQHLVTENGLKQCATVRGDAAGMERDSKPLAPLPGTRNSIARGARFGVF